MLQRQIMFKQLQDLQRRQQLQDLGGNQNYLNQLSSLKQASGGQFPPTVNGISPHDQSQMFMVGNAQVMQHMGSGGVQGLTTGMFLPQGHHHVLGPLGLSQQQFDLSLYGNPAPNIDKNLSRFSHLQEPSNLSMDLLTKNSDNPLGMLTMQQPAFGNSFLSQRDNFSSDQISRADGSLLPNPGKNFFGNIPVHGFNNGAISSGSYTQQGIAMQRNSLFPESDQRNEDGWHGHSLGISSKLGLSDSPASLDPLEQKILYSNDDSIWGPTVEDTSHIDTVPPIQIGSWSALMQSAVAETSSSDTGMQEEWSSLSFQNPEPDNQTTNFIEKEMLQNNWVDRTSQNITSPSSKPENSFQNSNANSSFPGFQHSGHQYPNNREDLHHQSPHASAQHSPRNTSVSTDYDGQQKYPMGGGPLIQTSKPSPGFWPVQHNQHLEQHGTTNNQPFGNLPGYDLGGNSLVNDNTSHHLAVGNHKPFNQVNQLNIHSYPLESEKIAVGDNARHMSSPSGASSDHQGQIITSQSESMLELLNKDDISNDREAGMQVNSKMLLQAESSAASLGKPNNTHPMSQGFEFRAGQQLDSRIPESFSFFPPISTVNSGAVSITSHIANDYVKPPNAAPQIQSQMAVEFSPYSSADSQDTSQPKITDPGGPGSPHFKNMAPLVTSLPLQNVGFPGGLAAQWPNSTTRQDISSPKSYKSSNNIFRPLDSTSSSLDTSLGFPKEQPVHQSMKLEYRQNQSDNGNSAPEGSMDVNNANPLIKISHHLDSSPKVQPAPDAVLSGDIGGCSGSLIQDYSQLHAVHSPKNAESDYGKMLPVQYEGVNFQQAFANARELFFGGQRTGLNIKTKTDTDKELSSVSSGDKEQNLLPESQGDKVSPMAHVQNFQQNDSRIHHVSSNETSNVTPQSQINLQVAPSWFKHYGILKNGQMLNSRGPAGASQPFSQMTLGNMLETHSIPQSKFSAGQGNISWQSSSAALLPGQPMLPPSLLLSDITNQTLSVQMPKKRKMVEIDIIPWNKEINSEPLRLQNISFAELQWAQVSNRKLEEVKGESETVEGVRVPIVRAKRRLVFTTELMQQVFRPPAAVILRADASSNCEYLPYSAARLVLGDACSLNSQLPPDANDSSTCKPKISTRNDGASDFSKVVEGLIILVKKLEDDLSRVDKSISIVDIKVAMQELEKFAMINRFARYHIKAQQNAADPASSTPSKPSPQRYVVAVPMPKTLPEGIDCLSL